jgi:hypothetical protein
MKEMWRRGKKPGRVRSGKVFDCIQLERKPHAALLLSVLTPLIYAGPFVFATFVSAFMLKARDRPLYRHMVLARVLTLPPLQLLRPECLRRDSKQRSIKPLSTSGLQLGFRR